MKKTMKSWAVLLCVVMLFTAVSIQGFAIEAADVTTAVADTDVVKVTKEDGTETCYATLQEAFNGFAPSNNTYGGKYVITLLGDTAGPVSKTLQYPTAALDITLDLNGHTITGVSTAAVISINFGSQSSVSGSTFTITDSAGGGTITGGSQGVNFIGKNCTLYFNAGTITGNHGATKGGGILLGATAHLIMNGGVITGNSVTGTGSANTGYGGGICGNYVTINSGTVTGNYAYKGTVLQTGRGGGVCTEITRTRGYSTLTIADGTVYGNFADNAGDDVMAQGNGVAATKHTLVIGTENWYIDGWNGTKAGAGGGETDRYSAENPVPYTDGGWTDVNNKAVGLKHVASATYVARLESTGEKYEKLQDALDAAKASLAGDLDEDTITLLSNTTESVSLNWSRNAGNMTLTIDLNGYTVTGDGTSSVMTFSGSTAYNGAYNIVIKDSSDAKTGTITGGNATNGGAINLSSAKNVDSLTIDGGNFVNNAATNGGGAINVATVGCDVIINDGYFSGNTATNGGAISACTLTVNGGVITGNTANGEGSNTGRGGGISMWGPYALSLNVTGGQIYGNTASRYGDDIVFCSTNKTTASMSLLDAAEMKVEGVSGWYVDGYSGSFSSEAGMTDRYGANDVYTEFTDYAGFSGSKAKGVVVALKAGEEPVVVPAAPDKFGQNVTPALVCVICDSDSNHASLNIAWQHQSTKVLDDAPVWNEELGVWTIDVRIDNISTYYVWLNFEKANNDISHDLVVGAPVPEGKNYIDATLKWDDDKELWVTMDGNPIEIHTACTTKPDAPSWQLKDYQIKVTGIVDGEEKLYYVYVDLANVTVGEVQGSRTEGFWADVTVKITEDDAVQAGWIEKRDPEASVADYSYYWNKTQETITFTVYYTRDTSGELTGSESGDWALENGKTSGTIGEAYLIPAAPEAPDKFGKNVTPALICVFCDSDSDHAPIDIAWQHQSTKVLDDAPVWNEELGIWTIDVRIDSISTYYVWLNFDKVNNDISHDLVVGAPLPEGKNYIDTTLKWDYDKELWVTMDGNPIEIHTTCKTQPDAPIHVQMDSYQIQVMGDLDRDGVYGENGLLNNGVWEMYITSIPEGGYTVSEVYGSREEGFFVDVTVTLEDGDIYITNWIEKRAPGKYYNYDWDMTEKTVVFTLEYTGDLNGELYGSGSGDWVLSTTGKAYGAVAQAYLKQVTSTVNLVIYRNGDTTTPYKTVYLGQIGKGETFDLTELNIADYYSSAYGYEFEGWYNDGGWNNYKAGNKNNTLGDEIVINGWTNIICMVYDYQTVVIRGVVNGDIDTAETIYTGKILFGTNLISWLDANVTLPEKPGYTANTWWNWDWYGHKFDDSKTVTGWTNVYVDYQANEYTLTLDPNDGKIDISTITVTFDEAIGELPVPTKEGYTFGGWVDANGTKVTAETVYTVVGDSTLTATWTANTYVITLDAQGGEVDPATVNVVFDQAVNTLPVPGKTGYTFVGWFDAEGNEYTAETVYTVAADVTLIAKWTANTYTITLDDGSEEPTSKDVTFDALVGELPVLTKEGYTFAGWVDAEGNVYTAETVYTVAADVTLTAKWTANEYTLTLDTGDGTTETVKITYGEAIGELPVPTKEGYTFAGWVDAEGNAVTAETVYTTAGGITLTATWTANEYTLTLNAGNGTTETIKITYGEAIGKLPVPTKAGYTFGGWFDANGTKVTAETVYTVAGDSTLTAVWTANTYVITLDAQGGEVDPATVNVVFNQAVNTLPVPTKEGYTFAGWVDAEGNAVTAETVYTTVGGSTLTATWTANEYTLTLDIGNGTTETVELTYGEAIGELPVPTKKGYTFAGWVDAEGNAVTAETVYTTAGGITLTATWTANTYVITLDAQGGEVDPDTVNVVFDQAVNKLPVPTKEGYTFEGWLDSEDNLVTEDTIYTFTSDVVYTASWKAVVSGSTDSSDNGICLVIFAVLFILIICAVVIALILKNRKKRLSK